MSPTTAARLDARLAGFEAETGRQVFVAIFPKLPSPSLEDFAVRTAQAWRIGRKGLDDGAILFVFVQDRKLRIEVGYGLEGQVPDAIASRIIDERIAPLLKAGQADAALTAGVEALLAAASGQRLPAPANATDGDVPMPATEGFQDHAGVVSNAAAQAIIERLARIKDTSGCRLAVTILDGPPARHSGGYTEPQLFVTRSFFRARPRPSGAADADYFEALDKDPSAHLMVFVTERQPLQALAGYYGSGSCLAEAAGRALLDSELLPRFPADPGGALQVALDLYTEAQKGTWTPPTPAPEIPTSPREPTPLDVAFEALKAIASYEVAGLPLGVGFLILAFPTLTSPVLRFLPIRRRVKRGEPLPKAWLIESAILLWIVVSNLGSSRSSGGRSYGGGGSSGGGGGRFGGGGASGSW